MRAAVGWSALALAALVYGLANGLDGLLARDRAGRHNDVIEDWRLSDRIDAVVSYGTMPVLAVTAALIGLLALRAGRPRAALAAAAIVLGAALGSQVLKLVLAGTDPLGGEAVRESAGAYPSGHSATALAVALAAVVAAPPRRRPIVAASGALAATALAALILALNWHYPSDVAGAFLLTLAWTAAVVAALDPDAADAARPAPPGGWAPAAAAGLTLLAGAALGAAAIAGLAGDAPTAFAAEHPAFTVTSAAAGLVAVAATVATGSLLAPADRGGSRMASRSPGRPRRGPNVREV